MFGGELLNNHFCKTCQNIFNETAKQMPIFTFPIVSQWKPYVAIAIKVIEQWQKKKKKKKNRKKRRRRFIEANAMNNSAKIKHYPPNRF